LYPNCNSDWEIAIKRYLFPGTAALVAVVVPFLTAPDHRKIIALLAYIAGLSIALWLAFFFGAWKEFITAAAIGGLSLVYILLRTPNKIITPLTQDTSQVRDH